MPQRLSVWYVDGPICSIRLTFIDVTRCSADVPVVFDREPDEHLHYTCSMLFEIDLPTCDAGFYIHVPRMTDIGLRTHVFGQYLTRYPAVSGARLAINHASVGHRFVCDAIPILTSDSTVSKQIT